MWRWVCIRGLGGAFGLFILTLGAGCTISIQPWSKHAPPAVQEPPLGMPPGPFLGNNGISRAVYPPHAGGPESMVHLISRLNEAEDQCKICQDQVVYLKKKLRERDESLQEAGQEIEESIKQMKRTRTDLSRWQSDLEELRERVRKLADSRDALKKMIETVVRELEFDREMRLPPVNPKLSK